MSGESQLLSTTDLAVYEAVATMRNEGQQATTERIIAQTDLDEGEVRTSLERLRELDMLRGFDLGPEDWNVWGLNP